MQGRYQPNALEEKILKFWKAHGVYNKVKKSSAKKPTFFFLDGPPYATGNIHMGTAWNKILKDCYIRFWHMQGFDVWDQPGYDTHGTPIEIKVEKELGFKSKKDIESLGIDKFTDKCRKFATKYIGVMNSQFSNLGVWMDWKHPYLTLDNSYIEGAWYTFKKAFEKGMLFRDTYPVLDCPRCETVVAFNEVEYIKQTDTSIYVKFPVLGAENKFLIIWTTTPWTLPGNTGIMVHPDFVYVEAQVGNETWIIAKERLQELMNALEAGYRILDEFKGKKLDGVRYKSPLEEELAIPDSDLKGGYKVILSDRYVNLEEGTGLVHTAPGHGKEDFDAGKKAGLPVLCPVGLDGVLTKKAGKYAGKRARVVDEEIILDLENKGLLVYKHPYTHDYPICWRCETPLLQIGIPQWFFRVTKIRAKLLAENRKVNWVPRWAGERFQDWLENLGDWPVSRQRYWGIPLPIWECSSKGCGHIEVIGSFAELKKLSGLRKEIDFHRPAIDSVKFQCSKCGKPMQRIPDVLDVWFDSGVASWASLGYPRRKELFNKMWPSTLQVEGPDQFRGWWNSEIITSILTFGRAPFRNILLHGLVMDLKGVKLSKSKGNFISPEDIVKEHGRDVLRMYLLSSPAWNDFYFKWEDVKETSRFFTVLWNTYQFVKSYAGGHHRKPALEPEDRWVISRLNSTLLAGAEARDYQMHKFVQAAKDFLLNDFSRWYIKVVRDRVSPFYKGDDKPGAQYALNYVLERMTRALAPVIPFITEEIYQDLYAGKSKSSVHMQEWPKPDNAAVDAELEWQMDVAKQLIEAMATARQEKGAKLRWPLDKVFVQPKDAKSGNAIKAFGGVIKSMANVKRIVAVKRISGKSRGFEHGRFAIGGVLKDEALVRELIRKTQLLRKKAGLRVHERIKVQFECGKETEPILKKMADEIKEGVGASHVKLGGLRNAQGSLEFDGKKIGIGFVKGKS